MPQTSFALMTNLGRDKEAAAFASATTVEITHIAIGDGATVPSGGETALYNQLALKTISGSGTVVGADNVAYFDCFLEAAEGPYTIREAGLYDVDGDLIAIAHYDPPINKPVPASGQTVEGTVRLEVAFSNVANITISIDPSLQVALQRLTRLPWLPIISMSLATPPASPVAGDTYLIATSPTGSWSGQAGKIAEYTTAGWAIITPPDGHGVSLPDGRVFERISGTYVEKIALDSQSGKWIYAEDSGSVNALVVTLAPVPAAYVAGMVLQIKAANSNTGATTLNVNGLGAKSVVRRDGSVLLDSDIVSDAVQEYVYDGIKFQMPGAVGKPQMTRNLDIYVNGTLGDDANDGTANISGKALATLQGAVDLAYSYPPSQYTITIHVADGTYVGAMTPVFQGPDIVITGNAVTPSNVVIDGTTTTQGPAIYLRGPNTLSVQNLKVQSSASSPKTGSGFQAASGSTMTTSNTVSGICASFPVFTTDGGLITPGNHTFAASANGFFYATNGGIILLITPNVFTVSAALTVGITSQANDCGIIQATAPPPSFVNPSNVTAGKRYSSTLNGVINTQGAGSTYFPGVDAGTTSTGGQYA